MLTYMFNYLYTKKGLTKQMNFKKLFSNIQFNKTSASKIDINLDRVGELIQKRKDKIKKAEEDDLEKVQLCFDNIKNKVDNLMKLHKFVSENDIEVIGDIFFNKHMKPVLVGGVTGFGIEDIWGYYLIFVNNKGISFLDIIDKSVKPFKQADLAVEFCDMFAEYYNTVFVNFFKVYGETDIFLIKG